MYGQYKLKGYDDIVRHTGFVSRVYYGESEKHKRQYRFVADWIEEAAALKPEAEILDLCCGTASSTSLLAAKGYRVTGIDMSGEMIRLAQKRLPPGSASRFICGNVLVVPFGTDFDLALCLDMTFMFDRKAGVRLLKKIHHALKSGGFLIIETYHKPAHPVESMRITLPDGAYRCELYFDIKKGLLNSKGIIAGTNGASYGFTNTAYIYSEAEWRSMLKQTNFTVTCCYEDFFKNALREDSRNIVVVAQKN
ncbi:MAG: class I SAM-dependent methyltransferase [Bacillota bacterium]